MCNISMLVMSTGELFRRKDTMSHHSVGSYLKEQFDIHVHLFISTPNETSQQVLLPLQYICGSMLKLGGIEMAHPSLVDSAWLHSVLTSLPDTFAYYNKEGRKLSELCFITDCFWHDPLEGPCRSCRCEKDCTSHAPKAPFVCITVKT